MINELELQAFLFDEEPKRTDLLNFSSSLAPTHRVLVYRNHSFELIENTLQPYLEYAGMCIEFVYSHYDDSLSFRELDVSVDAVILWLDLNAYQQPNIQQFIETRVTHLRAEFTGQILFAALPTTHQASGELDFGGLHVTQYDLLSLQQRLGERFFDYRLEAFSGTKLSNVASQEISRDLGLNYLPALLKPTLKGIIVDLDNTLYNGVLGEDGIDGVVLSPAHQQLQTKLKELVTNGFFLCIASKNDERDVLKLFEQRVDFPLQLDDFVQIHASWEYKSESIVRIAEALSVAVDSFLFIDDNPGELVAVRQAHPSIKLIWAKEDASKTCKIVANFPGLLKLTAKREDALRKDDTLANTKRQEMQQSLSQERFIKDLEMQLVFDVDNVEQVARISELANKTNQFIFSFQRYTQSDIERLMSSDNSTVVTVALSDRLSDSGIIAAVVLSKQADSGTLDECFVSCRALGRGIDEAIVLGAVRVAMNALNIKQRLMVEFKPGERNSPAETFYNTHFHSCAGKHGDFNYQIATELVAVTIN